MVSVDWKWVGEVSKLDLFLNTRVQTQFPKTILPVFLGKRTKRSGWEFLLEQIHTQLFFLLTSSSDHLRVQVAETLYVFSEASFYANLDLEQSQRGFACTISGKNATFFRV